MKEEIASIEGHGTWVLTPFSLQKVLGGRWIFTRKMGEAGEVERYKARWVVKGFMQRPGLEFTDVYAPVTSKATLRLLLATACARRMFMYQCDIKTAFLEGTLDPVLELYSVQPDGFEVTGPGKSRMICRLVKSLYGLKQAPRVWSDTVRKVLVKNGFRPSRFDPALYIKKVNDKWCYVLTYVDDFLILVQDRRYYDEIIAAMVAARWEVKQLGLPKQFLSLDMQVTLDEEGRCLQIILSQHNAIADLVERFPFTKKKQNTFIPMTGGDIVGDAVHSPLLPNNKAYISLAGSLIYLSTCTRPDISFAVSTLSRFSAAPSAAHWEASKRVLLYLKANKNLGLCYKYDPTQEFKLEIYSDASFGECKLSRRSQSGVAVLAGGSLVSWISKRQITPAISTGEAEYQALGAAARETLWLKHLRDDLGLPFLPVTIQCDSEGALSWCKDWKIVNMAKHIDVIHHYVKCLVEDGRLCVTYVNTHDNLADPFTKALAAGPFWLHLKRHGMVVFKLASSTPVP